MSNHPKQGNKLLSEFCHLITTITTRIVSPCSINSAIENFYLLLSPSITLRFVFLEQLQSLFCIFFSFQCRQNLTQYPAWVYLYLIFLVFSILKSHSRLGTITKFRFLYQANLSELIYFCSHLKSSKNHTLSDDFSGKRLTSLLRFA